MKKRPLSLLEVAIGLALTAILLTALFSSFRQSVQINAKVKKLTETLHPKFVMQMRLAKVFEGIDGGKFTLAQKDRTELPELIFLFDNGVDPDPLFVGEVEGRLFCRNKNLYLTLGVKKRKREELIFKGVENLSILCFDPGKQKWVKEWKEGVPPMIKIALGEETYAFTLPRADRRVVSE